MPTAKKLKQQSTLLRWPSKNTRLGVTKTAASLAADQLGMTVTQLIHAALAQYIAHALRQYETDYVALTRQDLREIRRRVPQQAEGPVLSSIID